MLETLTLVPALPAADVDRAIGFYRDKLGMEPVEVSEEGGARYEAGDSWFFLYPSAFAGTNQATAAGWRTDDVEALVAQLRGRGVIFEEYDFGEIQTVDGVATLPGGTKGAWFKDSEGNILGIFQDPA
jgi:catechol 2,3-dioxygenase-like lactoylglutathione lyase family enzyme